MKRAHVSFALNDTAFYRFSLIVPSIRTYMLEVLLSDFLNWIDEERFEELVRLVLTDKKSAKKLMDVLLKEYLSGRKERKEGKKGEERRDQKSFSLSKVEEFL